ncbi:regulation of nuclear pre-mRNA domain-containing protein 2a [Salarias fasciatus]|uniref:Regulation of nuclear pre-mRNA domain-containing protein 2 n=1 Tax=Salarias fasciatus TaxID=181472 RepID=A0A672FIJ8_SALFA|nr:regulation of nuclear pre-mRNA domain-containing protein 2 [Salarias fasciatus]
MAAGTGAALGGSLESTLDRKFQSVTNTMDSIQGLSTWCIDNKKYHSLIVRHWMKCLKKSDGAHRLNLLYLANDVIQNCKRKNAIVYRTAFAEVLPDAFLLVNNEGDLKTIKSVERILSIWDERGVYSRTLISDLRNALVKEESPPETPVEQRTPVESKADLRSKIVAEFVPQALIDQLSKYKRSLEEVDLREKQLTAMRVDICSTDALKKLKDKAGGKKFSRDFEEGSAQLQEFVKFFDKQSRMGPPLQEALRNADIFYEMQYKEVKIVANAYQTFANRVSHLKRKLDTLKATLPDLDDSPIPSPSADAPSPTGSESPFHDMELASPHPDLDGSAMDDDAEPPAPSPLSSPGGSPRPAEVLGENDNREVEDMELSDEEESASGIIVEEQIEPSPHPEVSTPICAKSEPSVATRQPTAQVAPPAAARAAAAASVDVGKIGSILSSLNSVMKTAAPVVENPPPAATPASSSVKNASAAPATAQDPASLVSLLSKVDVSPADLLSALSKVQGHGRLTGISSLLGSSAANASSESSSSGKTSPPPASTSVKAVPSQNPSPSSAAPLPSSSSSTVRHSTNAPEPPQTSGPASALVQAVHRDMDLTAESRPTLSSTSLESKIHSFLQGNPAFSAFDFGLSTNPGLGGGHLSPATGADTQDGTPVRDEGGGTPTLDEAMDKPFDSSMTQPSVGETAKPNPNANVYQNSTQQSLGAPQEQPLNGQPYQPYASERRTAAPAAHYQQISALTGPGPGERAPGSAGNAQAAEGFQGSSERSWYGDSYPEGSSQQPGVYNATAPGGPRENKTSGMYPYQTQEPPGLVSQQGAVTSPALFSSNLPPVPRLPPPPSGFELPLSSNSFGMRPPEQQPGLGEAAGARGGSVISGMVVHDHQHKSSFRPGDEPLRPQRPDDLPYQEDANRYPDEPRQHNPSFLQGNPYHHPDDSHYSPVSPAQHFPRVRGRLSPPRSPPEDPFYPHSYQQHGAPSPHYAPRRPPPPPRQDMRQPGLRPPHRPPHNMLPPQPRGPPRPPFARFPGPEPRLRGKRPGPPGPRGGGPMFPQKRPFLPPRY